MERQEWTRRDLILALSLSVLTLLSRWPYRARMLPATPRPRGLEEIALPYGRWLYALPVGRRPIEHAGYTFLKAKEPRRPARARS